MRVCKKAQTEKFITPFCSLLLHRPVRYYCSSARCCTTRCSLAGLRLAIGCIVHSSFSLSPVRVLWSYPIRWAFFGGIGAASKNGILITGSNYSLEALNHVKYVVFDKTGTLTKANLRGYRYSSNGRLIRSSSYWISLHIRSCIPVTPDCGDRFVMRIRDNGTKRV